MIVNVEGLVQYVQNFIAMQARAANAESLVVGVSGGVDSAVVYALAAGTGLPVHGVVMPCDSTPSAMERAYEVLDTFGGNRTRVNLEDAFDSIKEQAFEFRTAGIEIPASNQAAAESALRSCLRAPTLDYVSKLYNGIIVGTGNRDEDEVTRYFQKRGDGAVDISPIAKLHKSEVYELARHLGVPESVINAVPSADLLGQDSGQEDEASLGMTYDEIEKATRIVEQLFDGRTQGEAFLEAVKIMKKLETKNDRLIEVFTKLGHMEKNSRHKENPNLPVCNVRNPAYGFVE